MGIKHCKGGEFIADHAFLTKWYIDCYPKVKKRGLRGYWIERFRWYGKLKYTAVLDCSWNFCETAKTFDNIRDAHNWLCNNVKIKES